MFTALFKPGTTLLYVFKYFSLFLLQVPENKPLEAIHLALEAGFRHIDTAYVYQTENHVGQAIRSKIAAGLVKREDIFVTTKVLCVQCLGIQIS